MRPSSLQVTVTSELQGIAYIQVTIKQLEGKLTLYSRYNLKLLASLNMNYRNIVAVLQRGVA